MRNNDLLQFDTAGLLASGRSGWELLLILAAGFVLFRVLENAKKRREGHAPPRSSGSTPTPRASAAEQEDDAVAWWFTSGRYGGHDADHDGAGPDGPDRG